jgi:hypothetical protein
MSKKQPNGHKERCLEVSQHDYMHVALVPELKFCFSSLGTSSAGSFLGGGTLNTSAFLPPQTTHFCLLRCCCQQRLQKNSPPHQSNNRLIAQFSLHPRGMARLAGLAGDNVPPVLARIFDPRDLHRHYLATFNVMAPSDDDQRGGSCPVMRAKNLTTSSCDPGVSSHLLTKASTTLVLSRPRSCSHYWSSLRVHLRSLQSHPC